jgi:hypothetical protein
VALRDVVYRAIAATTRSSMKEPLPETVDDSVIVLARYLHSIPGVTIVGGGEDETGWWIGLNIDHRRKAAWNIVLELAHILNSFALNDPLPTVFRPVAPPPQGDNEDLAHLGWVIGCNNSRFRPEECATILRQWGPGPATEEKAWINFRKLSQRL